MNDRPVLLVGTALDPHIEAVSKGLEAKGFEALVVDTLDFPESPNITLGQRLDSISIDGRELGRPRAVYIRDVYTSPLSFLVDVADEMDADWRRTMVAFREKSQVLLPLLARWSHLGLPVYNPMSPDGRHTKAFQLALLEDAGLPVPETVWTNDPDVVRGFAQGRRIAYKPVGGGAATKELLAEDLTDERLDSLKAAPVTFQELLPGDNYRVYCLDGKVIACVRITSDALDYRQNEDVLEQTTLPEETLEQCIEAAAILGLRWTGIDLKRSASNEIKFLEANTSPMFLGFDARSGTGLLEALVNALAGHP